MAGDKNKQLIELLRQSGADIDELILSLGDGIAKDKENARWSFGDIVGRQFLGQGVALGFGDEIEAGVRSLFEGRSYSDIVDEIRKENAEFQRNNVDLALLAQGAGAVAGAFVPGGLAALAARGARGAGLATAARGAEGVADFFAPARAARAGRIMPSVTAPGASVVGVDAQQGAAFGALYGAGAASGDPDSAGNTIKSRLLGGAGGALVGGAGGAVGSAVIAGLGRGARAVANVGNSDRAADLALSRKLSESGLSAGQMLDHLHPRLRSGMTPEAMRAAQSEWARLPAGANAAERAAAVQRAAARTVNPQTGRPYSARTIADRFAHFDRSNASAQRTIYDLAAEATNEGRAEPLINAAEQAITFGGEPASIAAGRLAERQSGHLGRVVDMIQRATGGSGNVARWLERHGDDLKLWAGPEYAALSKSAINFADKPVKYAGAAQAVTDLRGRRAFKSIENLVRRSYQESGTKGAANLNWWSFDLVNDIQKALRVAERSANRSGNPTQAVRADEFRNQREAFLAVMDKAFPGFAGVRAGYHAGMDVIRAAEGGAGAVTAEGVNARRIVEMTIKHLNRPGISKAQRDGERQVFRNIIGDELIDRAMRQPEGANAVRKISSPIVRERLSEILGNQGRALGRGLAEESARVDRAFRITKGSPTARRAAGLQNTNDEIDSVIGAATGDISAWRKGLIKFLAAGRHRRMAEMLTRMDEKQIVQILERLLRTQPNQQLTDAAIAGAARLGSGALTAPIARRTGESLSF